MQNTAFRRISSGNDLTAREQIAGKTREVIGDGGAFLKVPGLIALLGIGVGTALGRAQLDMTEDRLYMVHPDETIPREKVEEQVFALDRDSYEQPVIMRSEISNHGVFQKGVTFYVTGEWEPKTTETDKKDVSRETSTILLPPGVSGSASQSGAQDEAKTTVAPPNEPQLDAPRSDLHGHFPEEDKDTGRDRNDIGGTAAPVESDADAQAAREARNEGKLEIEKTFVDNGETFNNLPDELKEGLRKLGSLEKAKNASNEELKAVGIHGLDMGRVRAAINRALAGQATA